MTRYNRLKINTYAAFLYQVVTVICGFIMPRLLIVYFGSDTNGLVNSIKNFLQVISFMELGVGAVVQSTFYGPLAEKDNKGISEIYNSSAGFFRRIALIFVLYVIGLAITYPIFVHSENGYYYLFFLIIIMSVNSFSQYYFGMTDRLLLIADQKGYIYYYMQIASILVTTLVSYIIIILGGSIYLVQIATSIIYLVRPLLLHVIVGKKYRIDRLSDSSIEPISQKYNGIMQHLSHFILMQTDIIVLTLFSTLENVSIYSIYSMIILGVEQIVTASMDGVQPMLGEQWAKKDFSGMKRDFQKFEWAVHNITCLLNGCLLVLCVPFVNIYTHGVHDATYNQPVFCSLLVFAHIFFCLRLPYHATIKAAVHYKQTQNIYLLTALMNLTISIILVNRIGLVGVTVGTLISMFVQTVLLARYVKRKIICDERMRTFKLFVADATYIVLGWELTSNIIGAPDNYQSWVILAITVFVIWLILGIIINCLFYREYIVFNRKG